MDDAGRRCIDVQEEGEDGAAVVAAAAATAAAAAATAQDEERLRFSIRSDRIVVVVVLPFDPLPLLCPFITPPVALPPVI